MIVALHVIIALLSIVFTSAAYLFPSLSKIRVACGLVAATLASGTYLVISQRARMLPTCETGLFYLAAVGLGIAAACRRLAVSKSFNNN